MKRLLICATLMGSTLTVHAQDNNRELQLEALKIRIEALDNQFADLVSRDEASKGLALEIMTGSAQCSGLYSALAEHANKMKDLSVALEDSFKAAGRGSVMEYFKNLPDVATHFQNWSDNEYNVASAHWRGARSANPSKDIDDVKNRARLHYKSLLDAKGKTNSEVNTKKMVCMRRVETVYLTSQKIKKSVHKNLDGDPEYQEWSKQLKKIDPDSIREYALKVLEESLRAHNSLMPRP